MALSPKEVDEAKAKIAAILRDAESVEDAERQFSALVGKPVKLKVIDPTAENVVALAFVQTLFGGKAIAKTGQMIDVASV